MYILKVKNLRNIKGAFESFPPKAKLAFSKGLGLLAMRGVAFAKKEAPVRTGYLRRSIQADIRPLKASIFPIAEYAPHVEFGTRPHIIVPVRTEALRWNNTFVKRVRHSGTKPNPFMARAAKALEREAEIIFSSVIEDLIREIGL